ncbi:MAG: adenylyl-sulfate kinase [Oligoflexia bacterium]|nr:adenylyl-sulfate kinase [Oligoflexia bacterium]
MNSMGVKAAGPVFWITGLSGSGKSTIANKVCARLRSQNHASILIDGDEVRDVLNSHLGHGLEDRKKNAQQISKLCKWLSGQGVPVVCATMSLFQEIHEWNRKNISNYYEVYLDTPMSVLEMRDTKKLYSGVKSGAMKDVIGVDLPFDAPKTPDLVLDTSQAPNSFEEIVDRIIRLAPDFR